ncbi:hypothetical protein [Wolbachia endosymbiont of Brugia pahangi]|uniref:hypothetical protein n=1 Tax=Wolbachia endosymbiont of Brugia pahangi TaxID=96495 RepID=UPI0014359E8E|nr:hypothetical protein [Wolbachia endosymbiont of Brugia pahangi]QIT36028.1 hypothetical protein WBP_0598 [Wolbachia endosymbiont of Brugia pahangi]
MIINEDIKHPEDALIVLIARSLRKVATKKAKEKLIEMILNLSVYYLEIVSELEYKEYE